MITPGGGGKSGRYVYGVVKAADEISLGPVGLEGSTVYIVASDSLGALVHDCPSLPYRSSNTDEAAAWVMAHHGVVEAAWNRWHTILPLAFNTIILADDSSAQENLAAWLSREHHSLESKLQALEGRSEYGVQVYWDVTAIAPTIMRSDPEMSQLETTIQECSPGAAYMHRQRLERLLKNAIESRAAVESKGLYRTLSRCGDNIRIEKPARDDREGRQMLLNVSCLLNNTGLAGLMAELDEIGAKDGFSTRLAGPFPPYSFC